MRLLILDLIRRGAPRALVFAGAHLLILWMFLQLGDPVRTFGVSMAAVFMLGPLTLLWFGPRVVWYLPVSRRDLWRGGWLVATVGTTLLMAAVKLVALGAVRSPNYGLSTVLLSTVFDFACAGIGCALVIVATHPRPARSPWRQLAPVWQSLAEFALFAGLFAMFYGGQYTDVLPLRWSDLTLASGTVLVAALLVTVATYFHSPSPPARVETGPLFMSASHPAFPGDAHRHAPPREAGGLSGLSMLLVDEYLRALLFGGGLAAASIVVVLAGAGIVDAEEAVAELMRAQIALLDGAAATRQSVGLKALAVVIWYAFFAAGMMARFPAMMRHLRVLPLSARQLNGMLVAWPAAIWVSMWACVFLARYAIAGHGLTSFHAALLVALCGMSALVLSCSLRLSGTSRILILAGASGVVGFLPMLEPPPPAVLAALGVGALAAAAILNAQALGRHRTYRAA